ncbi:Echinoderm microtubule-associated protein-like 1 [Liparis tanakae]|uniref:Echinoderm microtubule-associated protein-like 1 n=1 Tax=Liparis tanakae TaxID=230148 RepID=A0A4Z2FG37_9TELE|nr:Echinoderm microtubule-associated protein-like 1 [Liparis tanakae]
MSFDEVAAQLGRDLISWMLTTQSGDAKELMERHGCSSVASGLDVGDRLTYLEQRMQMQEDEIQLLKMALADVLKRLSVSEERRAAAVATAAASTGRRPSGSRARPLSLALPTRPPTMTSSAASLKKSSTLCSSPIARNYSPTPSCRGKSLIQLELSAQSEVRSIIAIIIIIIIIAIIIIIIIIIIIVTVIAVCGGGFLSPLISHGVMSPPGSVKDSPCKTPQRPPSAASTCRKPAESKAREAPAGVETRQVTHCKVTMQIYLSPLSKKTGSSEAAGSEAAGAAVPANGGGGGGGGRPSGAPSRPQGKGGGKPEAKKKTTTTPSFTLNLQKTTTSQSSAHDTHTHTHGYKSPMKSPSQYFQICY